jgi:uncharacterized phage protein (TIGR02216 family)
MAFGLGVLGLAPDLFWQMTPAEFAAAVRGRHGVARSGPPARADLEALMRAFPDAGCGDALATNDNGRSAG